MMNQGPSRYWKISPGRKAWAWDEFQQRKIIALGWPVSRDLNQVAPSSKEDIRPLVERIGKREEWNKQTIALGIKELWDIYHEMQLGDRVCAYGNKQVLGWGKVVSDYILEKDDFRYSHRRKVNWISTEPLSIERLSPELQKRIKLPPTIVELSQAEFEEIVKIANTAHQVWLFQANPQYYDLAAALTKAECGSTDGWSVTRYREEMHIGDTIVLWQSGKDAGIYAIGQLTGEPYQREWKPSKKDIEKHPFTKAEWWVSYRYIHILIVSPLSVVREAQRSSAVL